MHEDGRAWEIFYAVRKVSFWFVGMIIVLEALYDDDIPIKTLILGMIMMGVLPLEDLLPWTKKNNKHRDDDADIRSESRSRSNAANAGSASSAERPIEP